MLLSHWYSDGIPIAPSISSRSESLSQIAAFIQLGILQLPVWYLRSHVKLCPDIRDGELHSAIRSREAAVGTVAVSGFWPRFMSLGPDEILKGFKRSSPCS